MIRMIIRADAKPTRTRLLVNPTVSHSRRNERVTAATSTTSTIRLADPQNLPTTITDVNEIVFTGNLQGSGNINVLSNGQDNSPDGGNGFRLRGTGPLPGTGGPNLSLRVGNDWGSIDLATGERIAGLRPNLDASHQAQASIGAGGEPG